jgi:hypothetical protein
MPTAFLTFDRFNDPALAEAVAEKLQENGIECRILGDDGPFVSSIGPTQAVSSVSLQIRAEEFNRAHAILEAYYEDQLGEIDPEYFLYSFTDEELMDVVAKPDEWGHLNYVLARKILAERGKPLSTEEAGRLKQERLEELERPDDQGQVDIQLPLHPTGTFVNHSIATHKKTLPDGRQVYTHSEYSRKRARTFFFIGLTLILYVLVKYVFHLV